MDTIWLLTTGGGALLLACAIAYAMLRQRRLTSGEKQAQDASVHQLYRDEQKGPPRPLR
ncbi:MAG: hypothetical protein J0I23_08890 [Rhizobiales bacterium]|nr:hypothetical protein [Hyphomicrobiales bacterium]